MRTLTEQDAVDSALKDDLTTLDNDGQIVIYTGVFRWGDGSLHDEADPSIEDMSER